MHTEPAHRRRTKSGARPLPGVALANSGDGTWLALLAATSVGMNACAVQAEVVAQDLPARYDGCYRLVVHSYARKHLSDDGILAASARPHGSAQRSVTAEELRRGVRVSLVELGPRQGPAVLMAWVEEGEADLEFGGFEARPGHGVAQGFGELGSSGSRSPAHVVLRGTG